MTTTATQAQRESLDRALRRLVQLANLSAETRRRASHDQTMAAASGVCLPAADPLPGCRGVDAGVVGGEEQQRRGLL